MASRFARALVARPLAAAARPLTFTRLASSAVQDVNVSGIEGRYAMALYNSANKQNVLTKVDTDLKALKKLVETDKSVRSFLETPILNIAQKKTGLATIVKKAGFAPVTGNFLNVLAENSRLNQIEKIIDTFGSLMAAHRGEVQAVITTAKELDPKIRAQLEAAIRKNFVKASENLSVTTKVDPSILGGTVVQVGDKTIDLSVSTKLNRLNVLLAESV